MAKRLLKNDNQWDIAIEEAAQCKSAAKMRKLLPTLKIHFRTREVSNN